MILICISLIFCYIPFIIFSAVLYQRTEYHNICYATGTLASLWRIEWGVVQAACIDARLSGRGTRAFID